MGQTMEEEKGLPHDSDEEESSEESEDDQLFDNSKVDWRVKGNLLRGKDFPISQDGNCPRCQSNILVFVILDELFPMGDMPDIFYHLLRKGKAVLWSSQDNNLWKKAPTFMCRGSCPFDPLAAGFNINWDIVNLTKLLKGLLKLNFAKAQKKIQENGTKDENGVTKSGSLKDMEEKPKNETKFAGGKETKQTIKEQLSKTSTKSLVSIVTTSSSTIKITSATSSTLAATSYPISKDGSCPHCGSNAVRYIILVKDSAKDAKLPPTLEKLLQLRKAFKMAKGANDPPSFQCCSCLYGFNLDWSKTNLKKIFNLEESTQSNTYVQSTTAAVVQTAQSQYPSYPASNYVPYSPTVPSAIAYPSSYGYPSVMPAHPAVSGIIHQPYVTQYQGLQQPYQAGMPPLAYGQPVGPMIGPPNQFGHQYGDIYGGGPRLRVPTYGQRGTGGGKWKSGTNEHGQTVEEGDWHTSVDDYNSETASKFEKLLDKIDVNDDEKPPGEDTQAEFEVVRLPSKEKPKDDKDSNATVDLNTTKEILHCETEKPKDKPKDDKDSNATVDLSTTKEILHCETEKPNGDLIRNAEVFDNTQSTTVLSSSTKPTENSEAGKISQDVSQNDNERSLATNEIRHLLQERTDKIDYSSKDLAVSKNENDKLLAAHSPAHLSGVTADKTFKGVDVSRNENETSLIMTNELSYLPEDTTDNDKRHFSISENEYETRLTLGSHESVQLPEETKKNTTADKIAENVDVSHENEICQMSNKLPQMPKETKCNDEENETYEDFDVSNTTEQCTAQSRPKSSRLRKRASTGVSRKRLPRNAKAKKIDDNVEDAHFNNDESINNNGRKEGKRSEETSESNSVINDIIKDNVEDDSGSKRVTRARTLRQKK